MDDDKARLDAEEPLLEFFQHAHLPQILAEVSKAWCELAYHAVRTLPRTPERTVALRKLLESKDAAVRTALQSRKAKV